MKCKIQTLILGDELVTLDYHYGLKRALIILSQMIGERCQIQSHNEDELFLQMLYQGKACVYDQYGHMIAIERVT
jgi:hypothetical protein